MLKKLLISVMFIAIFFVNINVKSFAAGVSDLESKAGSFITAGQGAAEETSGAVVDAVTTEFQGLGEILTLIGAGIMVAVTTLMGIKYIISPPDKQAALKQQLIGLVVSGIVIFGAYGIWKAVLKIVSKFD